tara:strand:- start:1046 stop:2122 length:1077 start_codon:yes stop_codon:yes gene_type:complete
MKNYKLKTKKYIINVGNGNIFEFSNIIEKCGFKKTNIVILCDNITHEKCLPYILNLNPLLKKYPVITIQSGENSKTLQSCEYIFSKLLEMNIDKNSILINLGGGMICDIGGLVASLYRRGIKFINVPTSFLSMVDSSLGGKLAVNLNNFKNQIGLFNLPKVVFIDIYFLKTLSKRQFKNGMIEIFKHGLIFDVILWRKLLDFKFENENFILDIIKKSISIKNSIIEKDFREENVRKILNFGHTVGHALESLALTKKKDLLHGEAIAIGILVEVSLSHLYNNLSKKETLIIFKTIKSFFKIIKIKNIKELYFWMKNDKKNFDKRINFTLINRIGNAQIDNFFNFDQIKNGIEYYNKNLN